MAASPSGPSLPEKVTLAGINERGLLSRDIEGASKRDC